VRRRVWRASLWTAVFFALLWVLSMPASVFWRVTATGPTVGFGAGGISLLAGRPESSGFPPGSGLYVIDRMSGFPDSWWWRQFWLPQVTRVAPMPGQYRMPIWMFVLGFAGLGLAGRSRERRSRARAARKACVSCGYEVGVLPRCPECGATNPSSTIQLP
jgi:hypothetical protein